jgi:hypothetical protein
MRNHNIGMLSSIGVAAILLLATGCQTDKSHDERSEGRVIDDKNITETVKKDLDQDPTYKFDRVGVSTFAGVVQLSGFVNTADEKNRAAQVAENVDGVKQVHNGITLKPLMPPTSRKDSGQEIYSEPQNPSSQPDGNTPKSDQ